jgi:YVTN family beta-propeller protein
MKAYTFSFLAVLVMIAGCTSPNEPVNNTQNIPAASGVYVLNEGNYGDVQGGRLSLYLPESDTVYHSVVEAANGGAHLGSTADDFTLFRGKLYVLMSGSERLVVLSSVTHEILQDAYFPGDAPHALIIDSVRGNICITRLYKGSVVFVDLQTLHVKDSVSVGQNPMEMVLTGNRLFVCNSGYGADNSISVVNAETRTVETTLRVGAGPSGIVLGADGMLWVSCTGNDYSTPKLAGAVYRINPSAKMVTDSVTFVDPLSGTIASSIRGYVYVIGTSSSYFGGPIHRIAVASMGVTLNFIPGTFYGLGCDDASGDLYCADAMSFTSPGVVSIFTEGGVPKKSFTAERGPSLFLFRR